MSGLELLGAAAATTQLFGYLLDLVKTLLEIRDHIKNSSGRIQTYHQRLESLARTIQYIHENPTLLTQVVSGLLQTISQRVFALNDILRKSFSSTPRCASQKLMRMYKEKTAERRIRELLENLDSYKIDLAICISATPPMGVKHVNTGKEKEDGGILLNEATQNKSKLCNLVLFKFTHDTW